MTLGRYKLRIEAMLLKEEFEATWDQIEPSINAIIFAGRDLVTNPHLQEILYMVLVAGNFLNSVSIMSVLYLPVAATLCNLGSMQSSNSLVTVCRSGDPMLEGACV